MVIRDKHDCRKHSERLMATRQHPYHFVDSGLPNVYLSGVKYWVCKKCRKQSAEIPAVERLLNLLARDIVRSDAPLTGREIRFLRKRLGLPSSKFAEFTGVSIEQVSRWENGHNPPGPPADKLIRMMYCHLSGDKELQNLLKKQLARLLAAWAVNGQPARIQARLHNSEWESEAVPA